MKTLIERLDNGVDLQKGINQLNNAWKKRTYRLRRRLKYVMKSEFCYFMTFTIKPCHYDTGWDEHYRKKIRLTLNESDYYVFNRDYGGENERLHYHCVVGFKKKQNYKVLLERWKYGAINFKVINNKNPKAISRYLMKLENHALKESACKIYYKRK